MEETRKRLAPTLTTLRRLFALSGNVCAFHNRGYECDHILIDGKGRFVAEVCHIEAPAPGGERFNSQQTNEQCRSFENLLLFCHRHHVVTDDVGVWPVAAMRRLKSEHEARFAAGGTPAAAADAASRAIQAEIDVRDRTKDTELRLPESLASFDEFLGWGHTLEENRSTVDSLLRPTLEKLAHTPRAPRKLLQVIIERGGDYPDNSLAVSYPELQQATELPRQELSDLLHTLENAGLIGIDEDTPPFVVVRALDGLPFWRDLRHYAKAKRLFIDDFLIDLRFDLLD